MTRTTKIFQIVLATTILVTGFAFHAKSQDAYPKYQRSVSKELYDNIVSMDSVFFAAYNACRLDKMDSLLSENIEFYHDQGGLSTSKKQIMEALKNNICGKVTRELLKGSIEVYQVPGYGAIEMGFHAFHNNQEKETGPAHFSKFVHIWQQKNNRWKLTRIISLH